jgi:serine/threonine protein kinase
MTQPFTNETSPAVRHMTESELVRFALSADYELLEELGRGGMAIVYRAREKALDREVAIKVLPSRLVIDQGFVDRFEHEARTAAKLEHPNIVPIYRVGRAGPNGDVIYFVMKLLRGQSLSSVLAQRGKVEPSELRRILMETASALNYAAKQSVVHRDIKPDNIMLDNEGRCVITDFGIAKAPGGQQTTAGTSLGTPRYMSPEHAMGKTLDGRSDMYSLGVVAYQALFGKAPFEADEPFAVLYKHIHDPLPEPTLADDDTRQLYPIIARMLAKNPDDRYQTGNELIAALGGQISDPSLVGQMMLTQPGLMAATEVMPTPKPWSMARWRMLSRTRQMVWGAVAVLVFTTALGLGAMSILGDSTAAAAGTGSLITKNQRANASGTPPGVTGATVTTPAPGDSTAFPKPKPPSPRALAIIAANKVSSRCPKLADTLATTKPIAYALLVDSIADRPKADQLPVVYDVCGLAEKTPFSTKFVLTKKKNVIGRGGKELSVPALPEVSKGTRQHMRYSLNTKDMPPGDYHLDVTLIGKGKPPITVSRDYPLTHKYPCRPELRSGRQGHAARSASSTRSFARARERRAFDVPSGMSRISAISGCVCPWIRWRITTVRSSSGSDSIAPLMRCVRSGSASVAGAGRSGATSSDMWFERRRSRRLRLSPTDTVIECSHVRRLDSRRNIGSRWKARTNTSCVHSSAKSGPTIRNASR